MTYFLFLILHHKDYFLKWHDDIAQLDKMHPQYDVDSYETG